MGDFEVFERIHARQARYPTLTITTRGTLNLNAAAYEALGNPAAVELLYARTERTIGLRPVDEDNPNAYKVRPSGSTTSAGWRTQMVVAKSFCDWAEADLSAARRYRLTVKDGIGRVDLTDPAQQVVASNRTEHV